MEKLKVGLCGYGGMGHVHAANLAKMEDIEVVAVCDKRPAQLAAKDVAININTGKQEFDIRKCRTYADFRTMLKKEKLDAVVNALPTDLHAKFAILAMNQGVSVFSEKPMAISAAQGEAMLAARDKNRVQLQIGQCLRFWPEYETLLAAIREKTYGKLASLTMTRIGSYVPWASENWYNDHKRSGGAILDLHLHDVDWVIHAFGQPRSLAAGGFTGKSGGIDDLTSIWRYDGFLVTMRGSWKYHIGFAMSFQAFFEKASMDYGIHPEAALRIRRPGAEKDELLPVEKISAYFKELCYFFDTVRGRRKNLLCRAESTRESVRMVELEREVIKSGKWLKP
jgi:predicted dehydrogenase